LLGNGSVNRFPQKWRRTQQCNPFLSSGSVNTSIGVLLELALSFLSVQSGAPHINKPATDRNRNLVLSPKWVLDSKTDWSTVRRS
jgi:hypothetical protein